MKIWQIASRIVFSVEYIGSEATVLFILYLYVAHIINIFRSLSAPATRSRI